MVGCGAMAQLVARLHGMQKVRGSNPLSSTQVRGQLDNPTGPFLMPVPQPVPQRPYAAVRVSQFTRSRDHFPAARLDGRSGG